MVAKAAKGLTNWLMCLQGGEPMEFPEKCREIVEIGRKNNMMTMLVTSGFWIRDQKLCDFVLEKIRPMYLTFSINEWTSKHVPIEDINLMAELLKDRRDIVMFGSSVYGYTPDMTAEDNDFQKLDKSQKKINEQLRHRFFRTPVPLISRGRASRLDDRVPRFEVRDARIECNCGGITLDVDGSLYANCPNVKFGCRFGKLDDYKTLNDLADRIHKPRWIVNGCTFGAAEICRKVGANCLDPKWADSKYIERAEV